ncbi:MAG: universal stress protein [Verrucomicrobia bacterium]|nr:universal stress protein [Verrucomicrobiota bacterium]
MQTPATAAAGAVASRLGSIRTILVPTDFSAPAERALHYAEQLASYCQAKIVLLHAFDADEYVAGVMGPLSEYQARILEEDEATLHAIAKASQARGFRVEVRTGRGRPARQITQAAEECEAGLIVLSTHGRTGWRRFLMGSVAEAVVRHAHCPVLTVHARHESAHVLPVGQGLAAPPLQLRRVLFPTDFSVAAGEAQPWAEELVREAHGTLTLLHVFPAKSHLETPGRGLMTEAVEQVFEGAREHTREQLAAFAKAARERGAPTDSATAHGVAAQAICEQAELTRADLIVIATQGQTGWDRTLLGSTAERVVRLAECPVLVVRRPRL